MLSHLVLGTIAVVATARMYKYRKLCQQLSELELENRRRYAREEVQTAAQIVYLVDLLQKHGIEPSEFDMIALNFHAASE